MPSKELQYWENPPVADKCHCGRRLNGILAVEPLSPTEVMAHYYCGGCDRHWDAETTVGEK